MKNGFTLAEVLITLGVIGVVAAITLPTLIQNYKRHVVETKLQKFSSMMKQAQMLAENDYGSAKDWAYGNNLAKTKQYAEKYILPYLNGAKVETCDFHGAYACVLLPDGTQIALVLDYASLVLDTKKNKKRVLGKDCFPFNKVGWNASRGGYTDEWLNSRTQAQLENIYNSNCTNKIKNNDYVTYSGFCIDYSNICTYWIEKNGWKIPNNYPVKF